jgi:hypothetical protein
VVNNKVLIHKALGLKPDEIISENPFYQRKTSRQAGCQIDYLIQTKFSNLYICEIKFSKNQIDSSVIEEIQKKIDALKSPIGYSFRPVLIHVNGVTEDLLESDYFANIIDLKEFLNKGNRD